jgi:hypothetical protein
MASPRRDSRSASVSVLARARIFSAIIVPGVFSSVRSFRRGFIAFLPTRFRERVQGRKRTRAISASRGGPGGLLRFARPARAFSPEKRVEMQISCNGVNPANGGLGISERPCETDSMQPLSAAAQRASPLPSHRNRTWSHPNAPKRTKSLSQKSAAAVRGDSPPSQVVLGNRNICLHFGCGYAAPGKSA